MGYRFCVEGKPRGKPRMTRKDKWAQRDCVLRYWAWAQEIRATVYRSNPDILKRTAPISVEVVAFFSIPKGGAGRLDGVFQRREVRVPQPLT